MDEQPSGVLFSPNGELLLVTAFEQNHARFFASASGKDLGNRVPHVAGGANNRPLTPRFDARGEWLLVQSEKNVLQVIALNDDPSTDGPKLELSAAIAWMIFSEDGEQVHVITQDGKGTSWDWRTGRKGDTPVAQNSSGTADSSAEATGVSPFQQTPTSYIPNSIFSPNRSRYATLSSDNRVQVSTKGHLHADTLRYTKQSHIQGLL